LRRESEKRSPPPRSSAAAEPHLGHGRVDLQNLLLTFDLAHADFAGELGGGGAESLQREGTVQGLLVAAPHLREGELLRRQRENKKTGHRETVLHIRPLAPFDSFVYWLKCITNP